MALPVECTPHGLRAVFASMINVLFDSPYSASLTTMKSCGHSRLTESLAYGHVRLSNCVDLVGSYGPLFAEVKDSDSEEETILPNKRLRS